MEVLTAYVRENTHQASGTSSGSSDETSTSNEATVEADEGEEQAAPPEPRRPTADIQAILDVLRRAQTTVPEEARTRLDLHEANLRGGNLYRADLQESNLQGVNLQGANLQGANLQNAILQAADLQNAILQAADLKGANLYGANLHGATVRDKQLAEALSLQGAIMPDGAKNTSHRTP
jgi:hypothetical protein